ncbi:MAG TPA: SET domain-containing protein-lysine N-methyltransferase [Candidatus Limnocylindrales bacterium]|nr:SET domain-containing protein-lysine N-methyltransferase [Candidatus Limnocylindrales bacterium]
MHGRRGKRGEIKSKYAKFRLRIGRSKINGLGVFAMEDIPARRRVIEYTGKRLTLLQAIELKPSQDKYLVRIGMRWLLDGSRGGSGAERINHCCDPNLSWKRSRGRLAFYSRRRIREGEELTVRYAYPKKLTRIPCRCGAATCSGTLRYLLE